MVAVGLLLDLGRDSGLGLVSPEFSALISLPFGL